MRSYLFVPGNDERKLLKAKSVGADALILDLEDSVAPDQKEAARTIAAQYLADHRKAAPAPRLIVRINPLSDNNWRQDVAHLVPCRPYALLIPKTRSGEDITSLDTHLDNVERQNGIEKGATALMALVTEMPRSLLRMDSYIDISKRLQYLAWGGEDLATELGAQANRDEQGDYTAPFQLARSLCLLTASAGGMDALDAVYTNFRDPAGLRVEAKNAARDGFAGKLAIHPDQVPVINEVFTPDADDIREARAIIRAFEEAAGAGVVGYKGRMLDRPHLVRAQKTIARASMLDH